MRIRFLTPILIWANGFAFSADRSAWGLAFGTFGVGRMVVQLDGHQAEVLFGLEGVQSLFLTPAGDMDGEEESEYSRADAEAWAKACGDLARGGVPASLEAFRSLIAGTLEAFFRGYARTGPTVSTSSDERKAEPGTASAAAQAPNAAETKLEPLPEWPCVPRMRSLSPADWQ
jgi:hypothetical protein